LLIASFPTPNGGDGGAQLVSDIFLPPIAPDAKLP
jgi:hypothetical protein